MLEEPKLGSEQIEAYHRDGFVVVRQAFGGDAMVAVEEWASELAARPEESGRHWVYHERSQLDPDRELIARVENICPFHEGFAALARALEPSVGQLFGEPAVLFKEKINFKMPGGDGFKPHQDSQAGWEAYASDFITVALCIDRATIENGCLKLAAGHQKRGLYRAFEPLSDEEMADMTFEPWPMAPGDLVYLDSYAPHGSEPNHTDQTRRMYFATYNKASEGDHLKRYYADKHRNYPPDIDRDPSRRYVFRV
ncbi:MAG: phytanoyl-CoA dioxygenase family protein [Geminicoccaceae bacterium]|nr:phytanoyl-CoA dioxygenase family protein [Geminicoccaceae bacterium]